MLPDDSVIFAIFSIEKYFILNDSQLDDLTFNIMKKNNLFANTNLFSTFSIIFIDLKILYIEMSSFNSFFVLLALEHL